MKRVLTLGNSYSVIFIKELNGVLTVNRGYSFNSDKSYLNFGLYEVKEKEHQTTYTYRPLLSCGSFYEEYNKPSILGYLIEEIKLFKIINNGSTKVIFELSFVRTIESLETLHIYNETSYDYSTKANHAYILSNPIHFLFPTETSTILNIGFNQIKEYPLTKVFKVCDDKEKLIPFKNLDNDYISNRIEKYLSNVFFNVYEEGRCSPGDNYFYTELECKYFISPNFFDDFILDLLKKALKESTVIIENETSITINIGSERAYSPAFARRLIKENDNGARLKYVSKISMMYKLCEHYKFFTDNWENYKNTYKKTSNTNKSI
jgi:hypothetical protein